MAKPPNDDLAKLRQTIGTISRKDMRREAEELVEQPQPQQVQQTKKAGRKRARKKPEEPAGK